ncbi:MAG: YfcC family protein [Gemmatimonadetes bacterium]|nr:YfcC family protein [Gemmatimonadota bacterium]
MAKIRFPHPLTLLLGFIFLAAALSWVLPAGEFQRRDDPATGRSVVIPGTFHAVPAAPVSPFRALISIPKGLEDAADVVFVVFLVGASFVVVDRTGVLRRGVDRLVAGLQGRTLVVIPAVSILSALGGVMINMQEEFIGLIPALLILTRRMGFDPLVAVAMSLGAAAVGSAFSPINPFQVGIAQKLAQLPLLSGAPFRVAFLVLALAVWIWVTMRYAVRTRVAPEAAAAGAVEGSGARDAVVLLLVLGTFALYVYGSLKLEWGFDEMGALFFAMGVVAGLVGGLRVGGTVEAYVDGFRDLAFAGLLIGFARAIYVVLQQGRIVDTIVHGVVTPIAGLPVALSALGMMAAHILIHFPVPSVSGQAVLTMPVLVPVSDLLGLSRQVTVLAYQYGAGLTELVAPTNGALMAILIAAGVRYDRWLRFVLPLFAGLLGLGAVAVIVGIVTGLR